MNCQLHAHALTRFKELRRYHRRRSISQQREGIVMRRAVLSALVVLSAFGCLSFISSSAMAGSYYSGGYFGGGYYSGGYSVGGYHGGGYAPAYPHYGVVAQPSPCCHRGLFSSCYRSACSTYAPPPVYYAPPPAYPAAPAYDIGYGPCPPVQIPDGRGGWVWGAGCY
jgi:hypothetical protein